jgi:protein-tyrosine phosphatase
MIDIHSHILPGLDDGARSLAEAVEMVRIAGVAGTTDLVATPHANFEYAFDPARVRERLDALRAAAGPAVTLYSGCDLHLSPPNIEDALAHPTRYTINAGRYLLVEFPDVLISRTAAHDFARLIEAGMLPIITHPERNFLLHRRLDDLRRWIGLGCLVQVTAQSLTGRFGREAREFSLALLGDDLVHFVASDGHDPSDRPPRLDEAYRKVATRFGAARAERLFTTNPRATLTGDPLPPVPAPEPPPPRRWYCFWRPRGLPRVS